MSIQVINDINGREEYVLLPISTYEKIKPEIDKLTDDYVDFSIDDYIKNPIALMRIKANLTQEQLANKAKVTQAYISKLESQDKVSGKVIYKFKQLIN